MSRRAVLDLYVEAQEEPGHHDIIVSAGAEFDQLLERETRLGARRKKPELPSKSLQ